MKSPLLGWTGSVAWGFLAAPFRADEEAAGFSNEYSLSLRDRTSIKFVRVVAGFHFLSASLGLKLSFRSALPYGVGAARVKALHHCQLLGDPVGLTQAFDVRDVSPQGPAGKNRMSLEDSESFHYNTTNETHICTWVQRTQGAKKSGKVRDLCTEQQSAQISVPRLTAAQVGPAAPQSPQRESGCAEAGEPPGDGPNPEDLVGLKDEDDEEPSDDSADLVLENIFSFCFPPV